jgi:diphthamide synthase (EF-2-diphthine--ammonia ligase)
VAWSSGKDSALALQKILETDNYQITLLTLLPLDSDNQDN